MPGSRGTVAERCAHCVHFQSDPRVIESAVPGLATLSSGFASVRGDDGLCSHHGRHVPASAVCSAFAARPQE